MEYENNKEPSFYSGDPLRWLRRKLDPDYSGVTAQSIKEDHEWPFKTAGELMILKGRFKAYNLMNKQLEESRLRTQKWGPGIIDVKPVTTAKPRPRYNSIINDALTSNRFNVNYNRGVEVISNLSENINERIRGITSLATGEGLTQVGSGFKTDGGDKPVPDWIFNFKGTQFENTSDLEGLNKPSDLDTPQQERNWYAKLTYQRTLNEVLRQGGSKVDADRLFAKKKAYFEPLIDKRTGERKGKGIVATITELNNMMDRWQPGIQVRTTPYVKDGQQMYKFAFKDVDGKLTTWNFERKPIDGMLRSYSKTTFAKDHRSPVKDRSRVGGGYFGADNPGNFAILYQYINTIKSNEYQVPPELLRDQGVPTSLSEWVNMELYPQNYEDLAVPQRWAENYEKIVLAEFYEKSKGVKSIAKRNAIMNNIRKQQLDNFKNPTFVNGLELLEEALGQQVAKNMDEGVAAGNEVPAWIGLLRKPPGGWNSQDKWWLDLPREAKIRYQQMYNYNQRTIFRPHEQKGKGTKDYEI